MIVCRHFVYSLGSEYRNHIADNFFVRVHCQVGAFGSLG